MTTTGYVACFKGRLLEGSTLVVDGAEYPIPVLTPSGSNQAGDRVRAAAADAGYQIHGGFLDALSDIDAYGGYTIELEKI